MTILEFKEKYTDKLLSFEKEVLQIVQTELETSDTFHKECNISDLKEYIDVWLDEDFFDIDTEQYVSKFNEIDNYITIVSDEFNKQALYNRSMFTYTPENKSIPYTIDMCIRIAVYVAYMRLFKLLERE